MELSTITTFFGWCFILNIGVLLFSTLMLMLMKNTISKLHSKMFGVDECHLPELYFQYLAHFKIATIVLNLVPYLSLKLMA